MAHLGPIAVAPQSPTRVQSDAPIYESATTRIAPQPRVRIGVPPWWGPSGVTTQLPTYEIRATVKQVTDEEPLGVPCPNVRVALFFRRLNTLVDMQTSDQNGDVHFRNLMPGQQAYYGVALDPRGAPLQNSIILDRLSSVPATL